MGHLNFLLSVGLTALQCWSLSLLWLWFVVPFGVMPIGGWVWFSWSLIYMALRGGISRKDALAIIRDEVDDGEEVQMHLMKLLAMGILLLVAYLTHAYIP